jgi:anti-anti-sigma factor
MMINSAEMPNDSTGQCPVCDAPLEVQRAGGAQACSRCGHRVWFRRRCVDRVTVLDVISGTIAINADINRVSERLLCPGENPHVVLNLSRLKFISSAFVAGMIALQKRVRAAGGRFVLCGMHPVVRETLHGARLDSYFDICDDEHEALNSVRL